MAGRNVTSGRSGFHRKTFRNRGQSSVTIQHDALGGWPGGGGQMSAPLIQVFRVRYAKAPFLMSAPDTFNVAARRACRTSSSLRMDCGRGRVDCHKGVSARERRDGLLAMTDHRSLSLLLDSMAASKRQ
jgi:hypothetical protein